MRTDDDNNDENSRHNYTLYIIRQLHQNLLKFQTSLWPLVAVEHLHQIDHLNNKYYVRKIQTLV